MFIAALFIIIKIQKQPNCLLIHEGLKKMCVCVCIYIYTMDYYSAIKNNEIFPFTTAWMDLEGIMPSEVKSENSKYHDFTYYVESEKQNK